MKNFILPSLLLALWPFVSSATTEIIQNGSSGPTHIDTINNTALLNVRTTLTNGTPRFSLECKMGSDGKPLKNYFVYKVKDANGVVQTKSMQGDGYSCDQIRANESGFVSCTAYSAVRATVMDPPADQCGTAAAPANCVHGTTAQERKINVDFCKNDPNCTRLNAEFNKCGPEKLMLVGDQVTNHATLGDFNDKAHCRLDKKRVFLSGASWDNEESLFTQVYTSNKPGFFISNITHYYYDYKSNKWCIHLRADLGSVAPTCDAGYTGLTHAIDFATPNANNADQKDNHIRGAIKLTMENGQPVAIIGHSKSNSWSRHPEIDETKPVIKVTLQNDAQSGRRTVFQSMDTLNGSVRRALTVSPTYSFGQEFGTANTCDSSSCLRTIREVHGDTEDARRLACSNNRNPLDLSSASASDLCYSCNGVSSGTCGTQRDPGKEMLTSQNYASYVQKLHQCRTTPVDPGISPTTAQ